MKEQAGATGWQTAADGLNQTSLRALLAGEIAAIRIAGFASTDECLACSTEIRNRAGSAKAAETSTMALLGANFSNYAGSDRQGYFDQVGPSYETVGGIFSAAGIDPLQQMTERLRSFWQADVGVAEEPGYGRYFAGGIKTRATSGHLHYDFAPHTAPGFAIAGIVDQLGWNLYLEMPEGTGETTTWHRPVPREGGRIGTGPARALNLDSSFVDGAESFTFRPEVGDVMIINTRHPHDITVENADAGAWRVQTSSFIGRLPDDRLVFWS